MSKLTSFYISLLAVVIIALTSCDMQPSINGLWQSTNDSGTIEFKKSGEIIVLDNMSGMVTGQYKLKGDNLIEVELTASDILRNSLEPIPNEIWTAEVIKLNESELQLSFSENNKMESYARTH